jgi:hypothetical protein
MNNLRMRALALLTALLVAATPLAAAQAECTTRPSRDVLQSGRIMPLAEALARAGIPRQAVQNVQLCDDGGRFVYRFVVAQPGAAPQPVSIPAN